MRQTLLMIIVFALLALPVAALADELADVQAGIQKKYGQAKDLSFDFAQTTTLAQMGGIERTASGRIFLAQPNKLRWEYDTPTKKQIISDGATLVMVSEEEKKAYVTKTGAQFDIRQPLAILTGQVDLCNTYEASLLEPADGRKRLKLVPKKQMGFQSMILHVDPNTSLVQAIESVDAYGNKTMLRLNNQQFNRGLPDSKFVFTPRDDIEIVDQPMLDF